jgi:hypothetical protein
MTHTRRRERSEAIQGCRAAAVALDRRVASLLAMTALKHEVLPLTPYMGFNFS